MEGDSINILCATFQTGQSDRFPNQVATVLRFLLVVSGTAKRCLFLIGLIIFSPILRPKSKHSSCVERRTFIHSSLHTRLQGRTDIPLFTSCLDGIRCLSDFVPFSFPHPPPPKKNEKAACFLSGLPQACRTRSAVQLERSSIHAAECLTSAVLLAGRCVFPRLRGATIFSIIMAQGRPSRWKKEEEICVHLWKSRFC